MGDASNRSRKERARKGAFFHVRHGSALPGAGFAGPDDGSGFGGGFAAGGPSDKLKQVLRHYASGGTVENFGDGGLKGPLLGASLEGIEALAKKVPELLPSIFKRRPLRSTPQRMDFSGIWGDPREIARVANDMVSPEHPSLKQIFGVTREDLLNDYGNRTGNLSGADLLSPMKSRRPPTAGSIENTMTPRNAQRLVDIIAEAKKYPNLVAGSNFYPLDPLFHRTEQLMPRDDAVDQFRRFNLLTGYNSPGSSVEDEIRRGASAQHFAAQGRLNEWLMNAGTPEELRDRYFPDDLRYLKPGPYHKSGTAPGVARVLPDFDYRSMVGTDRPKLPLYVGASGIPETGFQTDYPVLDTHMVRQIGLHDIRPNYPDAMPKVNDAHVFAPWFAKNVAQPHDLSSTRAQALLWNVLGPQTGIKTTVAVPKLEQYSRYFSQRANELGLDPNEVTDQVLRGEERARGGFLRGYADGGESAAQPPLAAINWVKDLPGLFGDVSRTASDLVRKWALRNGGEGLTTGIERMRPQDLPFTNGSEKSVTISPAIDAMIQSYLSRDQPFFTAHSHPLNTADLPSNDVLMGRASSTLLHNLNAMGKGFSGPINPSVGDLQVLWAHNLGPSGTPLHTMFITGGSAYPHNVTALRGSDTALERGVRYNMSRGRPVDPQRAADALLDANRYFGLGDSEHHLPMSMLFNNALGDRGLDVMVDADAATQGGTKLKDLTPEYLKYIQRQNILPQGWFRKGGKVAYDDGGATPGVLAAVPIDALLKKISVLSPSRLAQLGKLIGKEFGAFQKNRFERLADQTDLSHFSNEALTQAMRTQGLLTTMRPEYFEDYAARLPPDIDAYSPYIRGEYEMRKNGIEPDYEGYVGPYGYLSRIMTPGTPFIGPTGLKLKSQGAGQMPSLWLSPGYALPEVADHEGRHRMRALANMGETSAPVQILPGNDGLRRGDAEEAVQRQLETFFPLGHAQMIYPQGGARRGPPVALPDLPFEQGGAVPGYQDGGSYGVLASPLKLLTTLARDVIGKPSTVKIPGVGDIPAHPIKELEDIAGRFATRHGNPYPIDSYPAYDPERAKRIATEYDLMRDDPTNPEVRRSYEALVDETMDQYRALSGLGLDFRFLKPGEGNPYKLSPAQGYHDLLNNGRLFVFPTEGGYGTLSEAARDQPLLQRVGRVGDLDNATANDAFRIVHDMLGHYGPGNPFFRSKGEERAWLAHMRSYSPDAAPAATSELRGQNSWVNAGPYAERNRGASQDDTIYADQKTGLMPDWTWLDTGYAPGHAKGGVVGDKVSKASVDYSPGMDGRFCHTCVHYLGGACNRVRGHIDRDYWCRLFKHEHAYAEGGAVEHYDDGGFKGPVPAVSAKLAERIGQWISEITHSHPLAVSTPEKVLPKVLADQRYKSQFETGSSMGLFDNDARRATEFTLFDLPHDLDPALRPIYGHVLHPDQLSSAVNYGPWKAVLSERVKPRSTFFFGDSLEQSPSELGPYRFEPADSAFNKDKLGFDSNYFAHTDHLSPLPDIIGDKNYIEAQIHNGLPLSDVNGYLRIRPWGSFIHTPDDIQSFADQSGLPFFYQTDHSAYHDPGSWFRAQPGGAAAQHLPVDLEDMWSLLHKKKGGAVDDDLELSHPLFFGDGGAVKTALDLVRRGIKAWHGSPHIFDRFDSSRIGSGEGNQVFGHGLYFAENPATAKYYRSTLAGDDPEWFDASGKRWANGSLTKELMRAAGVDSPGVRSPHAPQFLDTLTGITYGQSPDVFRDKYAHIPGINDAIDHLISNYDLRRPGALYEVSLAHDPGMMLNLDRKIGEHSDIMQDAVAAAANPVWTTSHRGSFQDWTGSDFLRGLEAHGSVPDAARRLSDVGITGTRFWDNYSRPYGNQYEDLLNEYGGRDEALKALITGSSYRDPALDYLERPAPTRNYVSFPGYDDLINVDQVHRAKGGAVDDYGLYDVVQDAFASGGFFNGGMNGY